MVTAEGKNFVLIGAAGYVAPKHMKAIKDVGGNLIACLDPADNVGILDSYFPYSKFFTEFERFQRFCFKFKRTEPIDYVVVCSPNYLHDAHCRFGLQLGADVICEKPITLTTRNLDELIQLEEETGGKVYTILQLRLNEQLKKLKENPPHPSSSIELLYYTPRGVWYDYSWKSDESKSGGVATNIGIHLFDVITWIFGEVLDYKLFLKDSRNIAGKLSLLRADVTFDLSTNTRLAPNRTLSINNEKINLSDGFLDAHTKSYQHILSGNGFGISDVYNSIQLVENLREVEVK